MNVVNILLAIAVILVGLFIVMDVNEGKDNIINVSTTVECQVAQGVCVPEGECENRDELAASCGEEATCCQERNDD